MKRGGGLHPARPGCWPPTKQPRATPGGLIAASVTCLSRREGVSPCLRTSSPLGGTLGVHRTSWRIPFPRHACMFLVLGFRGAWVSHAPPRVPKQRWPQDAALPPVSGSCLAGSPAWHGLPQCPGCGHWVSYCWLAFVVGSGLRLVVGFVNPCPSWLGSWVGVFGFGLWCCPSFAGCLWCSWLGFWCRPAFGSCVVSCAFPLSPTVSGSGVRCGRACWARVSAVPRPPWLGCRGVFFARFCLFVFFFSGCWVSLSWAATKIFST